ncbi:hypothetical protein SAMN05443248_8874 [Bradyrhizobium erythrophlei]|jgi:hypothetical protein|uniref:Uncharacterized protein n=1 Tax=Bradyrhizobium erythrophlei TaxID=1437360 RepID=A0A1M5YWN7_9BRAD|nr:hypothetical protein SAMN05443248_8874 [Bradyrhizobium erythrophlei]
MNRMRDEISSLHAPPVRKRASRTLKRLPSGLATRRANQCMVVQPLEKKYSGFPKTQITAIYVASRPTQRGVSRSSRTLERDAVDAKVSLTNDTDADGEVVWS